LLKVDATRLANDGEGIEDRINTVSVLVNDLEEQLVLLSTCWEGLAWAAYQENIAKLIDRIKQVHNYVIQYAGCFLLASQDYIHAEQDIMGEIG